MKLMHTSSLVTQTLRNHFFPIYFLRGSNPPDLRIAPPMRGVPGLCYSFQLKSIKA